MKYLFSLLLISSMFSVSAQTEQELKQKMHNNLRAAGGSPELMATNLRSDTVDIRNYNITLNITDFSTNVITGNTTLTFAPKINGVTQLRLDLLELTVDSVYMNGTPVTHSHNDTLIHIILDMTYNIGDTQSVTVYYHGTPVADASWGGFYFQSGYAYNMGVGFDALPHVFGRVWFPCFDNFIERSTYKFNITTNGGKVAVCNGALALDTTIASDRTRVWVMDEEIPTYLASVAVAPFAHVNQTFSGMNGAVPVILAAVPLDTTNVKNSFINLELAFDTYEQRFGPYMWNRVGFSFVPFAAGAMEHATNVAYPRSFASGSLAYQSIMAHELSHHWFGDLATCRTAEDMWLNEGWAHYCEFIFAEALSGYPAYLSAMRTNHEDNLHFNHVKEGGYQTLSNIPQNITYGDHVYNKGADVAHTLRGYMGDSLFFYSVTDYLANNNYKDVSSADFRDALTAASGMNMNDFFDGWVMNPGWPHFSVDSFAVVPAGPNFNVTVYVKQKLTGAPALYNNVPLEVTFKDANWVEQTQSFIMNGATNSFSFNTPIDPAFVAVNMGEKICDAVAPEMKTITTTGNKNFTNAKMTINVSALSAGDSAFVRVTHNYTAPDGFINCCPPYRLSPNHYWKIDGILPSVFDATATISYDGRTTAFSGNLWLDNLLNITTEDSLVLMFRPNTATDWSVFPYYTKNVIGSLTDKRGTITMDSVILGEYTFGMMDWTVGIKPVGESADEISMKLYPNPAKDNLTIDLYASFMKIPENSQVLITDATGKLIYKEKIGKKENKINVNTSGFANGMYFVSIRSNNSVIAKSKFIIAH